MLLALLLSIIGNDVPAAPPAEAATQVAPKRCENARTEWVDVQASAAPAKRALADEPLANAYRPVVRHVDCDHPVIVASRVGERQR